MRFDEVFGPGRSTSARPELPPLAWARIQRADLRTRYRHVESTLDRIAGERNRMSFLGLLEEQG